MRIRRKMYKGWIKTFIKNNDILHILRCTARENKTSLRYTFFNGAKFV